MKKLAFCLLATALAVSGCQQSPGEVTGKVLADWGLRERPEGYVSGSDRIYEKLRDVGAGELDRMNRQGRSGEVRYEQDGLRGAYFKEVKYYDNFYPLDVRPLSNTSQGRGGYHGYIEYTYRILQGARAATRAEAEATNADIPTGDEGREVYRYRFNEGGAWDGGKGERAKQ